jgi:hypothetical protein
METVNTNTTKHITKNLSLQFNDKLTLHTLIHSGLLWGFDVPIPANASAGGFYSVQCQAWLLTDQAPHGND